MLPQSGTQWPRAQFLGFPVLCYPQLWELGSSRSLQLPPWGAGTQLGPSQGHRPAHAPRDRNRHLKTQLFQSRKSSLRTLYGSAYNHYHLFGKLSHCYNKICRSKALIAQPFLIPETMPIFFHHIRSGMVGEGQECEERGKCNLRSGKCVKI